VDEAMMQEVAAVKAAVNPQEILFVVDSMTGQDAVNTAKASMTGWTLRASC
jgi:signal recognition particle subunit SRP54